MTTEKTRKGTDWAHWNQVAAPPGALLSVPRLQHRKWCGRFGFLMPPCAAPLCIRGQSASAPGPPCLSAARRPYLSPPFLRFSVTLLILSSHLRGEFSEFCLFLPPRFHSLPHPARGKHTPRAFSSCTYSPFSGLSYPLIHVISHFYQMAPNLKFLALVYFLNCSIVFPGAQNTSPGHPPGASKSVIFTWSCSPSCRHYFCSLRPQCSVTQSPLWIRL